MAGKSFLIFGFQGLLMAVDTTAVRELLWLMEIAPLEGAPPYIIGAMNFRGRIVPIIDLNLRFGHSPQRYHTTDSVIALDMGKTLIGVIVNNIQDVLDVCSESITPSPLTDLNIKLPSQFVRQVARVGQDTVMILSHEDLLQDIDLNEQLILDRPGSQAPSSRYFCPEASDEERSIFRERAGNLAQESFAERLTELNAIAVVELNGEFFGVGLEFVKGFSDISDITHIPCAPRHVVGAMNLRGNVLILVDIRGLFGMTIDQAKKPSKFMLIEFGDLSVGVVVGQVHDVIYASPADIGPLPSANARTHEKFVRGLVPYGGKAMIVLDLGSLFTSELLLQAKNLNGDVKSIQSLEPDRDQISFQPGG